MPSKHVEGRDLVLEKVLLQDVTAYGYDIRYDLFVPSGCYGDISNAWNSTTTLGSGTDTYDMDCIRKDLSGDRVVTHNIFSGRTLPETYRLVGPVRAQVTLHLNQITSGSPKQYIAQLRVSAIYPMCNQDRYDLLNLAELNEHTLL